MRKSELVKEHSRQEKKENTDGFCRQGLFPQQLFSSRATVLIGAYEHSGSSSDGLFPVTEDKTGRTKGAPICQAKQRSTGAFQRK
ncbi:hypothetical protein STEG23_018702 [Scotinomys teguina]